MARTSPFSVTGKYEISIKSNLRDWNSLGKRENKHGNLGVANGAARYYHARHSSMLRPGP